MREVMREVMTEITRKAMREVMSLYVYGNRILFNGL